MTNCTAQRLLTNSYNRRLSNRVEYFNLFQDSVSTVTINENVIQNSILVGYATIAPAATKFQEGLNKRKDEDKCQLTSNEIAGAYVRCSQRVNT